MTQRLGIFAIGILLIFALSAGFVAAGFLLETPEEIPALGDSIVIDEYFKNGKALQAAYIAIPVLEPIPPVLWSVWVDVNGNGVFEKKERAVDKMSVLGEPGIDASFPLLFKGHGQLKKLLSRPAGEEVAVKIMLEPPFGFGTPATEEGIAELTDWDIGGILDPDPDRIGGISFGSFDSLLAVPVASAQRPGGNQINESNRGVPDLPARRGKANECVPLSVANSLIWLAQTHGFGSKMPTSTDNTVDELASDMGWTPGGVKNDEVMKGKQAFTDRHMLPITNKKIDNEVVNGKSNLWDKIVAELDKGEDVELIIDFKPSPNSSSTGGHAVTVVGANNLNRRQNIVVHDPATPPNREEGYHIDRNGQIVGYHKKAYVNFIVSESFIPQQQ